MILVDTSVWVDHFRLSEPQMEEGLIGGNILVHPFVIGEILMGSVNSVERIIALLTSMPTIGPVSDSVFYDCVTNFGIGGSGLGFVDTHLLAAASTTRGVSIWTRDKKLFAKAAELGCAHPAP